MSVAVLSNQFIRSIEDVASIDANQYREVQRNLQQRDVENVRHFADPVDVVRINGRGHDEQHLMSDNSVLGHYLQQGGLSGLATIYRSGQRFWEDGQTQEFERIQNIEPEHATIRVRERITEEQPEIRDKEVSIPESKTPALLPNAYPLPQVTSPLPASMPWETEAQRTLDVQG